MMTCTEYDSRLLEKWEGENEGEKQEWLKDFFQKYLQQFQHVVHNKCQWQHFSCFIRGLLSSLDRKSIEPIALYFFGKHAVRSMQQFFSRSTLDDEGLLERYQELLAEQISCEGSMLSVDESSFVKKGRNSIGVKRQYCGRLGKQENCQVGVFLAYAGEKGYGFVDRDLYIPKEWYDEEHETLRTECRLPEEKCFATKNQMARDMINQVIASKRFPIQWIGCDAAYGSDHAFLDGLKLPNNTWYFAATNSKEQVFLEWPQMVTTSEKLGRPRKHAKAVPGPVSVKSIADDPAIEWEQITLTEGSKGPVMAKVKVLRCVSSRSDGSRNYIKPGAEIWLYIRKYENGDIKYYVSNAPESILRKDLDRAATLRWPVEQCFEDGKSYLGMSHYECRTYPGWMRHMLFVMIAHLFTTKVEAQFKKKGIPLTKPMAVRLLQEILLNPVSRAVIIVCYHIRRNHIAYMSHRKKKLCSL